jgi:hypothetical protein
MQSEQTIEALKNNAVLSFYGWWQCIVCLFAFIALMAIWFHIGKKQKDYGQVFLALSVLCWSFSGCFDIYFTSLIEELLGEKENTDSLSAVAKLKVVNSGWRSICSLFNSLFILLSLPWFRYIPEKIDHIISSKYWAVIVGLPFLFCLIPTMRITLSGVGIGFIAELDVYYSILTLVFLAYVLWTSFYRRRLKLLSWLSLICIAVILAAQLFKFTDSEMYLTLSSAVFKSSLIMLFFALALSWVKELSENILPSSNQLSFTLNKVKTDTGRFQHYCNLSGIPGKESKEIALTPGSFALLETFISKRKSDDGWLEIKPKAETRKEKQYDIKDYNEIKRLLKQLLDGLFGKDNWTKTHHEMPLKEVLFENSETESRKIRLRLLPANINVGTPSL